MIRRILSLPCQVRTDRLLREYPQLEADSHLAANLPLPQRGVADERVMFKLLR